MPSEEAQAVKSTERLLPPPFSLTVSVIVPQALSSFRCRQLMIARHREVHPTQLRDALWASAETVPSTLEDLTYGIQKFL